MFAALQRLPPLPSPQRISHTSIPVTCHPSHLSRALKNVPNVVRCLQGIAVFSHYDIRHLLQAGIVPYIIN